MVREMFIQGLRLSNTKKTKYLLDLPQTQDASHNQDYYILSRGIPSYSFNLPMASWVMGRSKVFYSPPRPPQSHLRKVLDVDDADRKVLFFVFNNQQRTQQNKKQFGNLKHTQCQTIVFVRLCRKNVSN